MENANRTYNAAKDKCWWLPRMSDREKAKTAFLTALAKFGASTPSGQIVNMTVVLLTEYGLACMDEWHYIHNKLHWSEYHFDMAEFYKNVINTQ